MDRKPTAMSPGRSRDIVSNTRYYHQNAKQAIQDVYDALIELITNADDRYQILGEGGRIEIEVQRKRKDTPSTIRVRDFADGMSLQAMEEKLGQFGSRWASGMAKGERVRGTNSRGAKDVAVLGGATFESIPAEDGMYHKCEITSRFKFRPHEPSLEVTKRIRRSLGIAAGTGTVVTVTVKSSTTVPQHDQLRQKLPCLVALRDIVGSKNRSIVLRDVNRKREDVIEPLHTKGEVKLKERFTVPGYPGAEAKLVVKRARKRFEIEPPKFRECGLLVQSEHAIHEATYFDPGLETDPHALWFFGKLRCEYIDYLWNEYDERLEKGLPDIAENPSHIVDPQRKQGLRRDHPFTKALFSAALGHFRPLVEAERQREEKHQARIESEQTRKRLSKLQNAAAKFMQKHLVSEEMAKEQDSKSAESTFMKDGFALSPAFAQLVQGQSSPFSLTIRQELYPELAVGESVEISCLTDEVSSSKRYAQLETHPNQEGVIRCTWTVKAERPTKATGVQVHAGSIVAESVLEILESEAQRYEDVDSLCFHRKQYSVVVGKGRYIKILAPCPKLVSTPTPIKITCSDRAFRIKGAQVLQPHEDWGVAICKIRVDATEAEHRGRLEATLGEFTVVTELVSRLPAGAPIQIKIVDKEFGNQRSKWTQNILEIAARHPSVKRYLGPPPNYPHQEETYFRVLLAEVVSEAVCGRVLGDWIRENPMDWYDADWEAYYAVYSKFMTEFLPIAHELQVKAP